MENEIKQHLIRIIITLAIIFGYPVIKQLSRVLIKRYGTLKKKKENRTNHIIRLFMTIITITLILIIIIIWGVEPGHILVTLSSVFAVIGAGLFAQWSVLSNVTAGIIIFFSSPFRIGDQIKIHDSEIFEAQIEDVLTFYTRLITPQGEVIIYPNSLLLQKGISVLSDNEESEN